MNLLLGVILIFNCSILFAEALAPLSNDNIDELMLTTANIPARGSVVVHCQVTLPHANGSEFNLYTAPLTGDFGQIEIREILYAEGPGWFNQYTNAVAVGSNIPIKIKPYKKKTADFYILQVKQNNEALIFDLRNAHKDPKNIPTKINCYF